MDWSKSRNILIILFIILNLFLGFNIYNLYGKEEISQKDIRTAVNILKTRGYTFDCDIPKHLKTFQISYENSEPDITIIRKLLGKESKSVGDGRFTSIGRVLTFESNNTFKFTNAAPNENIDIWEEEEVERYARKFLENIGINASKYELSTYKKGDNTSVLTFRENYKGLIIYNSFAEVTITPKGVRQLNCRLINIRGSKALAIVPIHNVLLRHLKAGESKSIKSIEILFKSFTWDQNKKEFGENPVWEVTLSKEAMPRYFDVITGEPIEEKVKTVN